MLKLILPVVLVSVVVGVAFYFILTQKSSTSNSSVPQAQVVQENAPKEVPKELPKLPVTTPIPTPSPVPVRSVSEVIADPNSTKISELQVQVKSLETANGLLLSRISKLEQSTGQTSSATQTTSSTAKSPVFIPLGPGGTIDSTDYSGLTNGQVAINTSDYPGYTKMYLLVNLQVFQGAGKAYARVANASNGLAVLSSEVSTNSYNPTLLTSDGFQLPSGNNTYLLQLKNLTPGYSAIAGQSWVKVVF